jgi:hypothetical protein
MECQDIGECDGAVELERDEFLTSQDGDSGEPDDPAATYAGTSLMNIIPYGQPEPMPYSAPQHEIRDVKYEVAYPTQQLSNGKYN